MTDLTTLLADPMQALAIPREQAEALIIAATETESRARLVRELLTARVATPAPIAEQCGTDDDVVDDVQEAARLVHRSASWIRKHGHKLPGFTQPGGKGHKVAWSRRALTAWAAGS